MAHVSSETNVVHFPSEVLYDDYKLIIYGVRKNITTEKLKNQIERHFGIVQDVVLIPYINWNIAHVSCKDKTTYESLLNANKEAPLTALEIDYKIIEFSNTTAVESIDAKDEEFNILQLNHDCLRHICQICPLKTQIQLAKVSQILLDIISDIWLCEYRSFSYDMYELEIKQDLNAAEIRDFLTICGGYVDKLTIKTFFYFPLIQRHLANSACGNLIQMAKWYINANFCENLQFFGSVREIEIQGKFLADFTIKEMARYCKNLQVIRLLDADSKSLVGQHLHLLHNLQELCIKDCENLRPKHMIKACKSMRNLKNLNISDCRRLQEPRILVKMCDSLQCLENLKLSAVADANALDAILQLPKLQVLQFSWPNSFSDFEFLLFEKLLQHKSAQLVTLIFNNDRMTIENESKESMTPHKYALMREFTTAYGRVWRLNMASTETEMLSQFAQFTALREVHFIYCRLLTHTNLLDLCKVCKCLKLIKLIGCRMECDAKLLQTLKQLKLSGEVTTCELDIEGVLPLAELQRMRQHVETLPYRTETNFEPVLRSILCEFK